jgi:succinyl-CoA synthetase alpha subunit
VDRAKEIKDAIATLSADEQLELVAFIGEVSRIPEARQGDVVRRIEQFLKGQSSDKDDLFEMLRALRLELAAGGDATEGPER